MSEQRIATRYAKALYDKAEEHNIIDSVKNDMLSLQMLCRESRDFNLFIESPLYKSSVKNAVLEKIFSSHHSLTQGMYRLMVDKKREALIPAMGEVFVKIYNQKHQIVLVTVESAVPLSKQTLTEIENYVKMISSATSVEVTEKIDTSIIGGVTIEFNGQIFDNTVSTQLKKIKKELQIA
jgi:F-type H+-transporting ATPase subunit delta